MTNIKAKSTVWEKNAHSHFLLLVCQFCGFCTELNFGSLVQTFYWANINYDYIKDEKKLFSVSFIYFLLLKEALHPAHPSQLSDSHPLCVRGLCVS